MSSLQRPCLPFVFTQHALRQLALTIRRYSTAPKPPPIPASQAKPVIYRSTCHDPWHNLAFEDWLFREMPLNDKRVLILWQNEPSVVIGRNQNPWLECALVDMQRDGINYVRRRSGGGAVYHDDGNINLTFMTSRDHYQKTRYSTMAAQALSSEFNLPVGVNDRNDLVLGGFKISGSAYKLGGKAAYHHCTLLVSSDVKSLGRYLKPERPTLVGKGVASVRSPVCTLQPLNPDLTIDSAFNTIANWFARPHNAEIITIDPSDWSKWPQLEKYYTDLKSWDWKYGQTPHFTHQLSHTFTWAQMEGQATSDRGRITELRLECDSDMLGDTELKAMCDALIGAPYGHEEEIRQRLQPMIVDDCSNELVDWLVATL